MRPHTMRRSIGMLVLATLAFGVFTGCFRADQAPTASFTRTPAAGEAPLSVFFDGSASVDPEGGLLTYNWSFGDGATATGTTATHTYAIAGTYEAVLTVTDLEGIRGTYSRMVTVSGAAVVVEPGNVVGQQAIDFTLDDLDGIEHALSDYRGLVVLLDFWASTCNPCTLTMPHLESLRERFAGDGLVVIGVSIDTSEHAARSFVETNGYTAFTILHSSEAEARAVKDQYDVEGVPHTFVIDRQGIIRHRDHPIRLRDRHIEPWI